MTELDYIIVGGGFGGLFFAHQLIKHGHSFKIFSADAPSASQVSAGVINPVVLKKFTTFWKAQEQISNLHSVLAALENYLGKNYWINEPVKRVFHDEAEKELWLKKAQKEELQPFLDLNFSTISGINNPAATGTVLQSGRLDVHHFFKDFYVFLEENNFLVREEFLYQDLLTESNIYHHYKFKNVVFCEGMGVSANPFFQKIPVQPNKGHHLKVSLQQPIEEKVTIKKKHFLFPLQDGNYYYGGTYDRDGRTFEVDEKAVSELKNGLETVYPSTYELLKVEVGFRPTVQDRRPILGRHSDFKNLYVFNGLGARGVLNSSYFSKNLYDFIENQIDLPFEVDVIRFNK